MNTIPVEFNQSLFTLSSPKKSFLSHSNQDILNKLTAGLRNNQKLFLVTGQRDCGKTTLVQRAITELATKTLTINISSDILTYEELLDCTGNKLRDEFSSESYVNVKTANLLDIKAANLKELIKTRSIKHIIFLVNQSIKFDPTILKKILKLINSTTFSSCSPHLIVTGSLGLKAKVKESNLPALLISDISVFQVEPLSETDIRSYIDFHLKSLKKQEQNLFSNAAIERIIVYSKGLPGLINNLCKQGLLTANIGEKTTITEEVMDEVLENSLFLGNKFDYKEQEPQLPASLSFNNIVTPIDPIENNKKSPTKNKLLKSDLDEKTMQQNSIKKKPTSQDGELEHVRKVQPIHKVHSLKKSQTPVDHTPKSIFISAFTMGIIFTALLGIGWNFFSEENQDQKSDNTHSSAEPVQQQSHSDLSIENQNTLSTPNNEESQNSLANNEVLTTPVVETYSSNKRKEVLQRLFQQAEQQLKSKQLISPAKNSAWATYKKILELNPNNQQALSGINTIKETYLGWAKNEINKGNSTRAAFFLNKALEVAPNDTEASESLLAIKRTPKTDDFKYIAELKSNLYKLLDQPNGVTTLLTIAQQRITEKNLTTPPNSNALSIYKLILSRYPEHNQALAGIKKIKNKYLAWAKNEIRQGNFRHAEYLYTKALEVSPSDPETLSDLNQLRNTTDNF